MLVYVVMALWLGMGALGMYHSASYADLAVYFLALTGFVASYIWGESVRPSRCTSIISGGSNSRREVLIYLCVAVWAAVGSLGVVRKMDLAELAAYYSALTPFVGTYIMGVSYRPVDAPTA